MLSESTELEPCWRKHVPRGGLWGLMACPHFLPPSLQTPPLLWCLNAVWSGSFLPWGLSWLMSCLLLLMTWTLCNCEPKQIFSFLSCFLSGYFCHGNRKNNKCSALCTRRAAGTLGRSGIVPVRGLVRQYTWDFKPMWVQISNCTPCWPKEMKEDGPLLI